MSRPSSVRCQQRPCQLPTIGRAGGARGQRGSPGHSHPPTFFYWLAVSCLCTKSHYHTVLLLLLNNVNKSRKTTRVGDISVTVYCRRNKEKHGGAKWKEMRAVTQDTYGDDSVFYLRFFLDAPPSPWSPPPPRLRRPHQLRLSSSRLEKGPPWVHASRQRCPQAAHSCTEYREAQTQTHASSPLAHQRPTPDPRLPGRSILL